MGYKSERIKGWNFISAAKLAFFAKKKFFSQKSR